MQNSSSKILGLLLLIFVVPVVFYTVFEINALNEDEEMIREIYDNQLDAILFSINQSSNDIVESWSNKIVDHIENSTDKQFDFDSIFEENLAVNAVLFFYDIPVTGQYQLFIKSNSIDKKDFLSHINDEMVRNKVKIGKLLDYMSSGYRKLEPLGVIGNGDSNVYQDNLLVFVLNENEDNYRYAAILMDPNYFIQQALAAKIQAISQEKFIISAVNGQNNGLVYSTEANPNIATGQKKPFWLFPDYFLNIILKGKTMELLVKERATINILLLVGLNLMLFAGLWFVFRNMKKALQLAQAKSDFVSNVSHEIRTPLSLISMFAETLQLNRAPSEEKKQEYYKVIGQEANRLTGIVNKILNFSKIEAEKKTYDFKQEELNEIIYNILKTYDYHLVNNGFTYKYQPSKKQIFVKVDRTAIEEAIINLIDNGMKYSKDIKSIVINTGVQNAFAYVSVEDKGLGISKEDQRHIFDKFFRAGKGEVHNTKGTGLGLSLVKHIVDAHHGKISVQSELGKGSIFQLMIPVATI